MARSRSMMSGFKWRAIFTASVPSQASPMTLRSGSASRRRRRPSRKIGLSSAITIRTGWGLRLSIRCFRLLRDTDFEPRALSRIRFYREFARNDTDPLFDHERSLAQRVQVHLREPSGEWEAAAVIFDHQRPAAVS